MKNWEKYEKEIKELGLGLGGFTITKSGEVDKCTNISCFKCKFCETDETCRATVVKWLFEDYEEPKPKLTMEERAIVSPYAGTTRDFIAERLSLGGYIFNVILLNSASLRSALGSLKFW